MSRFLFVNPPLVLDEDFIDYPYFANHGLLACAGLAARCGAQVEVYDAFALPDSGRHRRAGADSSSASSTRSSSPRLPDEPYDVVVLGASVFLRIEAAHAETHRLIAALRERFPRSVLLLSDGYVGGQHYMDYDAERVLAQLSRARRDPQVSGRALLRRSRISRDARRCARASCATAASAARDPLEPFYLPRRHRLGHFDGFLDRCFGDGPWQNTFGVGPGTRSFLTSIGCPHRCIFCTSNPGWRADRAQALPADPADAPQALGLPAAHRLRRATS